jgi:dihydroorotase
MDDLLITGGVVLDPALPEERAADIWIHDGDIAFVGSSEEAARRAPEGVPRLDATGRIVTPGLIDMHVHLREPGMEEEETVASGAAAAAAGGFTSVACMPNTDPPMDTESDMRFIVGQGQEAGFANVFPVGCITAGRRGEELAEMARMARGGAVAFSDDGAAVPTAGLLRQAMLYARMLGRPILEHCENPSLARGGVMHEGYISTVLGMQGVPAEAEEIVVARDIALARLTGAHLHIQHVSTGGSLAMIRRAKEEGLPVTAEVTPHHLTLTHERIREYDPVYKVNPPLRPPEDVAACRNALADGTIDAVASDHAPHLPEEKEQEFLYAPPGIIGLETTVGVLLEELVRPGLLPLRRLIESLTVAPAGILRLERGTLAEGAVADVTVLDMEQAWRVDCAAFRSRSRNCPYQGRTLRGRAVATVVAGRVVHALGREGE